MREVCGEYINLNPMQLGRVDANNDPMDVEIDETKHFHTKYHRGEWHEGYWVFGAVKDSPKDAVWSKYPIVDVFLS